MRALLLRSARSVEVATRRRLRLARIGDVEDVDVELLQVVDEHDVHLAGRPGSSRRTRSASGWPSSAARRCDCAPDFFVKSPAPSTSFLGWSGLRHVDERDAADAVRRPGAPLVLVHEQVALERRRVQRDDLRALAREGVDVARDVTDRLRVPPGCRVHVDDLHAAAAAGRLVEHRQVGVVALGGDVGDAPVAGELAAEVETADQVEPFLCRRHRVGRLTARRAMRVPMHPPAGVDPAVPCEGRWVRAGAARPYEKSPCGHDHAGGETSVHGSPSERSAPCAP